jgi:hypothetical protein
MESRLKGLFGEGFEVVKDPVKEMQEALRNTGLLLEVIDLPAKEFGSKKIVAAVIGAKEYAEFVEERNGQIAARNHMKEILHNINERPVPEDELEQEVSEFQWDILLQKGERAVGETGIDAAERAVHRWHTAHPPSH